MGQILQWCAVLILCSAVSGEIECAGENSVGDIALYDFGRDRSHNQGTVNVCLNLPNGGYGWVAFCYSGESTFNEGAAAAACRQAGYITQQHYSSIYFGDLPDVQYCINEIQCPLVKNYSLHGETVLLRCVHSLPTSCNCSDKAAVLCDKTLVYNDKVAYNGQVYRKTTQNSYMVYIYLEKKSLPICMDKKNQTIGNSICQQLGFTHAFLVESISVEEEESWYFNDQTCGLNPYACFTDCFNISAYTNITCTEPKTGIEVYCVYNETQSSLYGSGSKGLCEIYVTCPAVPSPKNYKTSTTALAVSFVLSSVIAIILGFVVIALGWKCKQLQDLQRNGYHVIPGDDQPIHDDDQHIPGDDQRIPVDEQHIPADDQRVPGDDQEVQGRQNVDAA